MTEEFKIAVSNMKMDSKLITGDPRWKTFNSSFQNLDLEMTQLLDMIYYGRAITTHHKNAWRENKNYLCGQHLGLDFDNEDEKSTLDFLVKDKFIVKYAAFIHTTISHTDEKPRARAIFLLDTPIMQAKNYALAAASLLWLYGEADRKCKDPARFFYGAPKCDFAYLSNVLPLDVVKKLIKNYVDSGQTERKRATRPDYLPPPSQQEVSEALKHIDPWKVDYDEWVGILMAIHSEFGEGGYPLAENWAQGKQGEVAQKWNSFHKDGNVTGAITIGTLFGIAKQHGWSRVQ